MAKKPSKLTSSKKLSFKNPAFLVVLILLIAAGLFLAFKTFAATSTSGTISESATSTKDPYGCPLNWKNRPIIKYGSSGACVKTLQNDLNTFNKDFYRKTTNVLTVDGKFGLGTKIYTVDYQNKMGLINDGVVGPATWYSLYCRTEPPLPNTYDCTE